MINNNFTEVKPLCYWVQHVLPLVYDDSLSYMELLGRVTKKLNELIVNNNKLPDFIAELIKDYISSGAIEKVLAEVLADYMLNVKFPPAGLTPATGDGSADDTEAIQGCIDYAFNHGGMAVYFPSGKYLTQPLTLKNKATLFGQDRYSTILVMKGGSTTAMFTGDVDELTLTGLGFDGNMDIQVNNVNLFTISVNSAIITNCLLTDGYDLLNITVNDNLQLNDVIFRHAIENSLVLKGAGIVHGNDLIFKSVSTLVGKNFVVMDVSKSILEQLKCYGASPNAVLINGSNNIVKMWNEQSLKAYTDNGVNNTVDVYTQSEQKKLTGFKTTNVRGDLTETVGGNKTETITGNKGVNVHDLTETVGGNKTETITGNKGVSVHDLTETVGGNKTETITGSKEVNATNGVSLTGKQIEVLTEEPIKYSKPISIENESKYFNYLSMQDVDNNTYNVLVLNEKTRLITEENNSYNIVNYGAKANEDITVILQNLINMCPAHGLIYIPWLGDKYIISNTITIDKPLTLISNYYGYEFGEGEPINAIPLISFIGSDVCFDISSYGTRIIGISIVANKATGFKFSYTSGAAPFPRFTVIQDCVVDNGDSGYNFTNAFRTIIKNCMAYNCNNGFLANTNTSLTFINCWARNIIGTAYNLVKSSYTSLINCAADTIGGDCAYYMQECYSIGLINCGCEVTDKRAIMAINCPGFNFSFHTQQNCLAVNDSSTVLIDGTSYGVLSGVNDSNGYSNNNKNIIISSASAVCIIGSKLNSIKFNNNDYTFNGAFWNSKNPE